MVPLNYQFIFKSNYKKQIIAFFLEKKKVKASSLIANTCAASKLLHYRIISIQ